MEKYKRMQEGKLNDSPKHSPKYSPKYKNEKSSKQKYEDELHGDFMEKYSKMKEGKLDDDHYKEKHYTKTTYDDGKYKHVDIEVKVTKEDSHDNYHTSSLAEIDHKHSSSKKKAKGKID
jgi:hypothetical protein